MNSLLTFVNQDPNVPSIPSFPVASPQKGSNSLDAATLSGLYNLGNYFSPSQIRTRTSSINTLSPLGSYSPARASILPNSAELTNLLLTWKLQQNFQAEFLKQQMQQILDLKSCLLEKISQNQAPMMESQIPALSPLSSLQTNSPLREEVLTKIEPSIEIPPLVTQQVTLQRKGLKGQVKEILNFVLENFGRVSESNFEKEKLKYSHDSDLVMVFDLLTAKYSSTIKTKEEMVKYTLRRAFKFIKNTLKKNCNSSNKAVSKTICSKYFHVSDQDMATIGTEEETLKVLLPFRKHSKNKTMNTTFIGEIFSSEEFCRDYQIYLEHFEGILEADNKNKIDRFASFIEECIRKRKIKDIKTYKRIPWPKLWILNTKNIAQNLPNMSSQSLLSPGSDPVKKCKKEADSVSQTNVGSMIDNDSCSDASTNSRSNY